MPPPEEPMPLPRPKPKPKPPKPKPPKPGPDLKPELRPERDQPDPIACAADCSESCAYYRLCLPPPSRAATVHPRSSRLPTPLVALSASLLAVSVVLLITLLVRRMVRRQRQRRRQTAPQEAPLTHHDEEGVPVPAVAVEEGEDADDGGVHHVWSIRTVGLDERAIAAITALVYDAKKCGCGVGLGGGGDDGRCAVCLAEFRDGETLRLLPRCGHAFHRGCIDTWLRAHVNCPLCRAPVQAASTNAAPGAATAAPGGEPATNHRAAGGAGTEEADRDGALPEHAVRRAASMVALRRPAWPDVSLRAPASNSGREGEMGLAKISRLFKLSEALEMAGIGVRRSVSFGTASCLRLLGRSGPSAAGINTDEMSR